MRQLLPIRQVRSEICQCQRGRAGKQAGGGERGETAYWRTVDASLIFLQVLSDVLAGKRVEVNVGESAYWRTFGGDQSPEDLETALQLVYKCVPNHDTRWSCP